MLSLQKKQLTSIRKLYQYILYIYIDAVCRTNEIYNQDDTGSCNDFECIGLNIILSPSMSFSLIVLYHSP